LPLDCLFNQLNPVHLMPYPIHPPWFYHINNKWYTVQIRNFSQYFLPFSCYFLSHTSKAPLLNVLPTRHRHTSRTTILHVWTVLEAQRKIKDSEWWQVFLNFNLLTISWWMWFWFGNIILKYYNFHAFF
jgi:hypothetical protein